MVARAARSCRVAAAPPLTRIVVAVDPPASARRARMPAASSPPAAARTARIYVLADETVAGLSPQGWARKAIALWRRL